MMSLRRKMKLPVPFPHLPLLLPYLFHHLHLLESPQVLRFINFKIHPYKIYCPLAPDRKVSSLKSEKLEQLKKKPAKRPDWNDLMKEIGQYKGGSRGLLKKIISNDRSKPMLSTHKVKGVVSFFFHITL